MARTSAQRLRDVAAVIENIAAAAEEGRADAAQFDGVIAHLRGLRREVLGTTRQPGSARARIRAYLIERVGETVHGEELAEVAGILAWSRRIRELRAEGMDIVELGGSRYRLERVPDSALDE